MKNEEKYRAANGSWEFKGLNMSFNVLRHSMKPHMTAIYKQLPLSNHFIDRYDNKLLHA